MELIIAIAAALFADASALNAKEAVTPLTPADNVERAAQEMNKPSDGAHTDYDPMKPFERFAGQTLIGEGTGPDGASITDIAQWRFILGGRALQTTHRIKGSDYGGRTIFFFDEGAREYIFHYFTTAGFHTTGTIEVIDDGFKSSEKILNHPRFTEVRTMITFDGDTIIVRSTHIDKEGTAGAPENQLIYRPYDGAGPQF